MRVFKSYKSFYLITIFSLCIFRNIFKSYLFPVRKVFFSDNDMSYFSIIF